MPWLKYAKDFFGNIVDIYNVKDSYIKEHGNDSFTCLACGCAMLTKRGKIKEHHFAHVAGQEGKCSYETYLHKLAVSKFIEIFKKRIEERKNLFVEIPKGKVCYKHICPYGNDNPCCDIDNYEMLPLLPHFDKCEREVRDGVFIPDILLSTDDGRKIYIEIAVTHFVKESKIESGIPIIEIKIGSECDLAVLNNDVFSQRDKRIRLYNFFQLMEDVVYDACERDLQYFKDQFVNFFNACKEDHLPIIGNYHYFTTCNQDCPYMEGTPCVKRNFKYFDILEYFFDIEKSKTDGFTPDLYMLNQAGDRIRFNFAFKLFRKSSVFEGEKTIQFALGNEIQPWQKRRISSEDNDIRYFNFETSIPENLCGEKGKLFQILKYYKNGNVTLSDVDFIGSIYKEIQNEKELIEDYILFPADYHFDLEHSKDDASRLFKKECDSCVYYDGYGDCKKDIEVRSNDVARHCAFFHRDLRMNGGCAYRRQYTGFEDLFEFWARYRLKL